jgi:hypothetical protein
MRKLIKNSETLSFADFIRLLDEENTIVVLAGKRDVLESDKPKLLQLGELLAQKTKNIILEAPIKNVKAQLKEVILNADQIKFGDEDVGVIVQYVDVSAKSHRYSIDSQVSDLLDVMLSKYPIVQRTRSVLNNIHLTIDRFKQLRELYSSFDEFNNITGPIVYGATYKPLEEYFEHFDKKLFWILPVVKNIKKIK